MLSAYVVHRCRSAEPVTERLVSLDRKVIKELAERLGACAVQSGYLLVRARCGEDLSGQAMDFTGYRAQCRPAAGRVPGPRRGASRPRFRAGPGVPAGIGLSLSPRRLGAMAAPPPGPGFFRV